MYKQAMDKNKKFVRDIFDDVADRYDLMNDVMSFGLQRYWKRQLIQEIPVSPQLKVLDLACGTGDIGYGYAEREKSLHPHITFCDPSHQMLEKAQAQQIDQNIRGNFEWVQGEAEALPFKDHQFDVCTVAFGVRNFTDTKKGLSEIYRVLKPGGCFLSLEFSQIEPHLYSLYRIYLKDIIPHIGQFVTENKKAYDYLADSILHFPDADTFQNMLEQMLFTSVTYRQLTKGIVALHRGWKNGY